MRKYPPATIEAALADAQEIGVAAAARKHGVAFYALNSHKRKRGLKIPARRGGFRGHRKQIDGDLEALRALFPAHITFSAREIAEIVGGISFQRIHAIEKKALRQIRNELYESGLMREAS